LFSHSFVLFLFARCIVELEKIYGIREGSFGQSDQNNFGGKTQTELAKEFDMTDQQLRNYKKLLTLIPELQDHTLIYNTSKNYQP